MLDSDTEESHSEIDEDQEAAIKNRLMSSSDDNSDKENKSSFNKKRNKKEKHKNKRTKNEFYLQRSFEAKKLRRVNAVINKIAKQEETVVSYPDMTKDGKWLPLVKEVFARFDDILKPVEAYAKSIGFQVKLCKGWSTYKSIICSRGGDIQLASVVKNKIKVAESNDRTGWPFKVNVKETSDGQWAVRDIINQHNHKMNEDWEPEFNETAQMAISKFRADLGAKISSSVKNYAFQLYFKEGYSKKEVTKMWFEKYMSEKPKEEEIINYLESWKILPGDNTEYLVCLAKNLLSWKEKYSDLDLKARKDLKFVCWTTIPKQRRHLISDAIAIDTWMTPDFNKSGWYLMIIQGINEYGIILPIFISLVYNINHSKMTEVLISYNELGFDNPFSVIWDDDVHVLEGLKNVFEINKYKGDPRLTICSDHFTKSLRGRLGSCEITNEWKKSEIINELYQIILIKDKDKYKQRFRSFLDKYESLPLVRKTIKRYFKNRNYLNNYLKMKNIKSWKNKQDKIFQKRILKVDKKNEKKFILGSGVNIPINLVYYKDRLRSYK